MADAFVSILLDRIETLMVQEASLLRTVEGEVRDLRYELESMLAFLKNSDAQEPSDEGVKALVKDVKDIALHTEDVLDEFALLIAQKNQRRFFGSLLKRVNLIKEFNRRHQIATQIQEHQTWVHGRKERRETYQLDFNGSDEGTSSGTGVNKCYDPLVASHYIEESDIVGLEQMRNELVQWLVEEDSRRTVIAVNGMGGSGKTTLVEEVYDDQRVEQHFHCRAWITVSKSIRVEELLAAMGKKFPNFPEAMTTFCSSETDEVDFIDKMSKYLRKRRYLVIFYDVQTIDLWESIRDALPLNSYGSRIILTTRSGEVASQCIEPYGHIYNLQPLLDEDARELFCKKAFRGHCPLELKKLSENIVKKCGGCPLAIVVIGSLMSTKKKTTFEWKKLHDTLGSELERNPILDQPVTGILSLSYNDLPYHLKLCWLYFGIFPEDYEISCSRLIGLWIAEGFVEERRGITLEDVAEEYLNELNQRSLIQAAKLYSDGRVKSCRVHHVLHEIIISKCKEENFFGIVGQQNTSYLHENIRRISIQNSDGNVPQNTNFSRLRCIFMVGVDKLPSFMPTLLANIRLVKVLDLQDAPLQKLPKDFGDLFHLRYLNLRNTKVKVLPKSSENLQNLETLNLKGTLVRELPAGMLKLQSLRHLLAFTSVDKYGLKVDGGIGCLTSLQNLTLIEEAYRSNDMISELGKLTQLRKLGIRLAENEDDAMDLSASIDKMNDLRSLKVFAYNADCLQSISHPPEHLGRLYLEGRLTKLPEWIRLLKHLVKLNLIDSALMDDPIRVLQALPNLVELNLNFAYSGEQLFFGAKGFQRLQILGLKYLSGLNLVTVEEGAMPILQTLTIEGCRDLQKVPSGIKHLRNLNRLDLHYTSNELERAVLRWDGEDRDNVKHIPFVSFHNRSFVGDMVYSIMQFLLTEARLKNEDLDSSHVTPSATQSLEIPLDRTREAIRNGKYPDLTWSREDIEKTMEQRARILSGSHSSGASTSTH